jgi:hypothetical protein
VYKLDIFRHTARQLESGGFEVQGLLSEEDIEKLRTHQYDVSIISDAEKAAKERLERR